MKFLKTNIPNEHLMLCNIMYHQGRKQNGYQDALDIIYKDTRTGEKFVETIDEPVIEAYFTKEEYRDYNYSKAFMPIDMLEKKRIKYKNLIFDIAKELGPVSQKFVQDCINNRSFSQTKNLHKHPYVFGSDMDLEAWYKIQWMIHYYDEKAPKPITKMFLDIEVDISRCVGFPKDGLHPINATTIVDPESKTAYLLFLRNPNSEAGQGVPEFEEKMEDFVKELHEEFDETYDVFDYKIMMFDSEKELIKMIFYIVNYHKPDFAMFWNQDFDIPYLIDRMLLLDMDPAEVICHPDFKFKEAYYVKDTRTFSIPSKSSYFMCSSYTVYIDQMVLYAALRKAGSELKSYKLGAIAKKEIKDEKLDYAEEGNFRDLCIKNYHKFALYSIKDTLLQFGIERKTKDLDNLYVRSLMNVVSYNKAFKQTKFLNYRGYYEYFQEGLIMGNNRNIEYGVDRGNGKEVKFSGALVADPRLNAKFGVMISGRLSRFIFRNVIDFDFSSLYPSIILAFNIAPNTLIAKLLVNESVDGLIKKFNKALEEREIEKRNREDDEKTTDNEEDEEDDAIIVEDQGKDFIDNLLTENIANTGKRWFNLPDINEICEAIESHYDIKKGV